MQKSFDMETHYALFRADSKSNRPLDLSHQNLDSQALQHLLNLMTSQPCAHLSHLILSHNPLGDESMPIIATILLNHSSITILELNEIGVTSEGCLKFDTVMQQDIFRLGHIVLSNNNIQDKGLTAFLEHINFRYDYNQGFPTIVCSNCNLTLEDVSSLNREVERYNQITLDISNNPLSESGIKNIYDLSVMFKHFKKFVLTGMDIATSQLHTLLRGALNSHFESVDMDNITLHRDHTKIGTVAFIVNVQNTILHQDVLIALTGFSVEYLSPNNVSHRNTWYFNLLSFKQCTFNLEAVRILSMLMQTRSVLTASFVDCHFPEEKGWITDLFSKKFLLTENLVLDNCNIDDDHFEELSPRLKNAVPNLLLFSLQSNKLTVRSLKKLERWVASEKKCAELNLTGNRIDEHHISPRFFKSEIITRLPLPKCENATPRIILRSPRIEKSTSSPRLKGSHASKYNNDRTEMSEPQSPHLVTLK